MHRNGLVLVGSVALACAALEPLCALAAEDTGARLPATVHAAQAEALRSLPEMRGFKVDANGIPTRIEAQLGVLRPDAATMTKDLQGLMSRLRPAFRMDGSEALLLRKATYDAGRRIAHYRMSQTIEGRRVIGGEAILHVDQVGSNVKAVDAQFLPGTGLPRRPEVAGRPAIAAAVRDSLGGTAVELRTEPEVVFARTPDGKGHLVWAAHVQYFDAAGATQIDEVLVDAITGRFVRRLPRLLPARFREIRHFQTNAVLITEGGTTTDAAATNVYNFAGHVYGYFNLNHGRDSWNGAGAPMRAFVHGTPSGQNNATFDCTTGNASFGDGNGVQFGSLANALDVVAHEWAHGVTCSTANLTYSGESGGINESMSDVFGAAVEAATQGLSAQTWLLGEVAYTPGVAGDALRYLNDPARDGISRDFYPEVLPTDDVHFSSGVGNLAFYLAAAGGTHPRGDTAVAVTGIGINKAARIWYLALRDRLLPDSGYAQARAATEQVASEQFGFRSPEHMATCRAWAAVGVPGDECPKEVDIKTLSAIISLILDE